MALGAIFSRAFTANISRLTAAGDRISEGDLSARSDIDKDDEIGELGNAFNSMADSIQEKITTLQEHNNRMEFELNIAGEVQQIIFPNIKEIK